jgi:hypothetical protein
MLTASIRPVGAQEHEMTSAGPGFRGFLFGDVTYFATERPAVPQGFFIGQLVGHGNATLSNHLSFFGELSVSARESQYLFEVERAILRYDFADQFKVSVGRYHTPLSYWNTAYHHGLWLQTSVARPEIIKIGGTFMPVHFVGVLAEGTLSNPVGSLTYAAGLGNGRSTSIGRGGDSGDANAKRATVLTASVRPAVFSGLQVGGSLYNDRVPLAAGGVDERTTTASVVWDRGAPELIAEYARVRHEPVAGGTVTTSDGYYVHAGMRLPGSLWRLKPYARIEKEDIATGDLPFAALRDYDAVIGGMRWDFEALAALKAEVRGEKFAGGERLNSLYVQVALVVPSIGQ